MKALAPLMLILMLSGCATKTVVSTPVEVKVPVAVPCVKDLPAKPVWATHAENSGDTYTRFKAVVAELFQRREYEAKLEAVLEACK